MLVNGWLCPITFILPFKNDHVHVVTDGIDQITEKGLLTKDGRLHEVDVIVLSTGFDAHAFMRPMNMTNEHGLTINKAWKKTIEAYPHNLPSRFFLISLWF